jgi:hypothetical protein
VSGAAGVSRRGAPARVRALCALLRSAAAGEPLDPSSGRALEVPLQLAPLIIAGRGDGILDVAGRCADRALLWAVPHSDLPRSASVIAAGAAAGREADGVRPELTWAPLVDHGGTSRARLLSIAAYSVLNSLAELHARWGLSGSDVTRLRTVLVGGGAAAAQSLIPSAALNDLIINDPDPHFVADQASKLGATSIAVPAFTVEEVPARVGWARATLDA